MSYRINRIMGWGMPWETFKELTKLAEADRLSEGLYNAFHNTCHDDLTIPESVMRSSWGSRTGRLSILSPHLATTTFVEIGKTPAPEDYGQATDLYRIVYDGDYPSNVVFLPALYYQAKWYRHDDDMDYVFEEWRKFFGADFLNPPSLYNEMSIRGQQASARNRTLYLPYGPHPYTNSLMNAVTGAPVKWDHFSVVEKHPEWVPDVPAEIRWYLPALGILDEAGVNQLRPCIAQWWS